MSNVRLTKKEIKELSSLSKINLTEKEVEKFTSEMETIISSVEALQNFDKQTDCKLEDVHFEEIGFEQLREDKIAPSMKQKDILANAPEHQNGYFKVYGEIFDGDNS